MNRRPVPAIAIAVALTAGAWSAVPAAPRHAAGLAAELPRQQRLEINDLGMQVGNNAIFALNQLTYDGGLEYPRGSGQGAGFAGGLWVSGRSGGAMRMVIAQYGSEWGAGPLVPSLSDTNQYRVFRISRGDATGEAEWNDFAVPLGAPGNLIGEQTLWSVCNDLAPSAVLPRQSGRITPPIGLEAQVTAYAFDRPGALRRVAFLRLRVIHGGAAALDSAAFGMFFDPKAVPYALRAASDTSRDMAYSYPADDPPGAEVIAVGVLWLGGPRVAGSRLRPSAHVVYPNGSDPGDALQFDRVLRGTLPWGAAMIDSSTGQPTTFYSSGDPVSGTGWNATMPPHPHTVLAAQPFTFAPGDTQDLDMGIVIGRGPDRDAAILDLRAAADEARAAFASGFTNLPAFEPYPAPGRLLAFPNPAGAGARIAFRVEAATEPVRASVYDAAGRRVRRLLDAPRVSGRHVIEWDGADDDGHRVGAGLYFVRVTIGGREHTARVVRLAGN